MRSVIPSLLLSLALTLGLLLAIPSAHAQEGSLRLVTSPLPISLAAEPGTTVSTQLKVKNAGSADETLKIDIMKFNAYEDSGKPALMELEPTDTLDDWVSFSEQTFTIAPEEWKTVTATFALPPEASFGYYYAFVFTRADTERELKPQETAMVGGTATLVLLEAKVPDAKREVTVAEFSTDRRIYEFLPATFTIALKNTGNVHVAPRGNIFLSQWDGKEVALLEVNEGKGNILPSSTRIFEADWKDGFPVYQEVIENGAVVLDETGQATLDLVWDWQEASKLRFGKYTAKLLLVYDDGERDVPIEGVVTFWVMPWRVVALILLNIGLLVGLSLYVIRLRRRLKQLQQR